MFNQVRYFTLFKCHFWWICINNMTTNWLLRKIALNETTYYATPQPLTERSHSIHAPLSPCHINYPASTAALHGESRIWGRLPCSRTHWRLPGRAEYLSEQPWQTTWRTLRVAAIAVAWVAPVELPWQSLTNCVQRKPFIHQHTVTALRVITCRHWNLKENSRHFAFILM